MTDPAPDEPLSYDLAEAAAKLGTSFTVDWLRARVRNRQIPFGKTGAGDGRAGRIFFTRQHLERILDQFSHEPDVAMSAAEMQPVTRRGPRVSTIVDTVRTPSGGVKDLTPDTTPAGETQVSPRPAGFDYAAAAAELGVSKAWLEEMTPKVPLPHSKFAVDADGRPSRKGRGPVVFSADDIAAIRQMFAVHAKGERPRPPAGPLTRGGRPSVSTRSTVPAPRAI